jgi:hypothetical protein
VNDEFLPDEVEMPIEGVLDLHTFQPGEVGDLVRDYLEICRERGILEVRIIHGKGTGALRETVHAVLGRLAWVSSFRLAGDDGSGWGATIATLAPPDGRAGEARTAQEGRSTEPAAGDAETEDGRRRKGSTWE